MKTACPYCDQPIEFPDSMLGEWLNCPNETCGKSFPLEVKTAPPAISSSAKNMSLPAGTYAAGTMQHDEKLIYQTSIHKIIYANYVFKVCVIPFLFLVCLLDSGDISRSEIWAMVGFVFVCGAVSITAAAIMCRTSELLITNQRVLIKVGFIGRRTIEIFISKIESVAVSQGIFGRLWNFGTVTVRGTGGSAEPFKMIANPLEFRNYVQQAQNRIDVSTPSHNLTATKN